MTQLTDNIAKFAKLRAMSLQEVALKAGLSKNIIYRWRLQGANPSPASITAIADALHVKKSDLTGEKESTEEKQTVDLKAQMTDQQVIITYEGKEIPKEDLELIKRILRG